LHGSVDAPDAGFPPVLPPIICSSSVSSPSIIWRDSHRRKPSVHTPCPHSYVAELHSRLRVLHPTLSTSLNEGSTSAMWVDPSLSHTSILPKPLLRCGYALLTSRQLQNTVLLLLRKNPSSPSHFPGLNSTVRTAVAIPDAPRTRYLRTSLLQRKDLLRRRLRA
jgi:hypothetical protein